MFPLVATVGTTGKGCILKMTCSVSNYTSQIVLENDIKFLPINSLFTLPQELKSLS